MDKHAGATGAPERAAPPEETPMRLKACGLFPPPALVAVATATLAAQEQAPSGREHAAGECHGGRGGREGKMFHKLARMEHRLDRAVEKGRLTQAQADQFKAE